jgi:hypothetical protein
MNSAVARRLTVYSVQPKLPPPYPWTFNVAVYGTPYAFRFDDEGQTWARGWDTEDARALEATVLLTASAR